MTDKNQYAAPLKFELPKENNIVFYNGGFPIEENEVMRIDRNGIKVNSKLSTDEATDAVIRCLDTYIKNLAQKEYQRGLEEARKQDEPVIDKSSAIRIATALGWTPPKQEQGELVAWVHAGALDAMINAGEGYAHIYPSKQIGASTPLYTTPQQRKPLNDISSPSGNLVFGTESPQPKREPLTLKDIKRIATYCGEHITDEDVIEITRRVEAAHGIKGEA